MKTKHESAREVLGDFLRQNREEQNISIYKVRKDTDLRPETIKAIESGSQSYNIDSLLTYIEATNLYIFFSQKHKEEPNPIDVNDMINSMREADPNL